MKSKNFLRTGKTITINIVERLSESYYIVKDYHDKSANEDTLTLISLPYNLDIQVGETITVDGNYLISEDINFINSTGVINLNRCDDPLSTLYVKEISELSKDLKDYDFVIQVYKNEAKINENIIHYIDGYKWEMSFKKQTITCIAPPADLSPNTFFYGQSSQRLFFNKNIPKTSERLRWNAAQMIAKTIIPYKKVSKYDCDKISTWLIMRDKRYSLEQNKKLINFIEECRSFEFICENNSYISITMKKIKDKFINKEYNGFQNEILDVLGLKEENIAPSLLINKSCKDYLKLKDNILTPSQIRKNIISSTHDTFLHKDKIENMTTQLHNFMKNSVSFDSESFDNYDFYSNNYYKTINEYKNFCIENNINDKQMIEGFFLNKKFLEITKKIERKTSYLILLKKTKNKIFLKQASEGKIENTLYSNRKWSMAPIQRQNILNSMTNNELINVLISQAKYIYGLVNEFIKNKIFSSNDRKSIRQEIINLGALIAETQFGIDKETHKKREYYFHFNNRYFREDYVALLRSIIFFDKIFNINVMMTFFDQLMCVLESIFSQDNYPNYEKVSVNHII